MQQRMARRTFSEEAFVINYQNFLMNPGVLTKFIQLVSQNKHVATAQQIIHENYLDAEFSMKVIYENSTCSHDHLCYLFKKDCGCSMRSYIFLCRLNELNGLCASYPLESLHALACQAGFPSYEDLKYLLQKRFDLYPSQYRDILINNTKKDYSLTNTNLLSSQLGKAGVVCILN